MHTTPEDPALSTMGRETMTTRSRGPLAGFGWLRNAVNLGHGNPKAVFGGAALVLLLSLLPSAVTMPLQFGMTPGPAMLGLVMAISVIGGLLLVPVLAGLLGVIDASENGRPAKATDVFGPYRRGEWLRLVGYGVAMIGVYIVAAAIVIAIAGAGVWRWYMQAMTMQQGEADPAALQALQTLPDGFGIAMALVMVLGLLIGGVYSISLGQVALGGRGVFGAIGDGIAGSFKNVLPLIVLAVCGLVAGIVLALVFGLAFGLLAVAAKLVGDWLMFALLVPVYLGAMLMLFVVMFGVIYHLWRDVCGGGEHGATAEALNA
jgi:hypothetical protein